MSGDYLTPAALTSRVIPEDDVILADGKVRVRGLSRGEIFVMQACRDSGGIKTEQEWERRMVSIAMVIPEMTEDEVASWQGEPAGGDLEKVTSRIQELSGLAQGADKSGVSGVREDTGSGVRVLPSDQAGEDRS